MVEINLLPYRAKIHAAKQRKLKRAAIITGLTLLSVTLFTHIFLASLLKKSERHTLQLKKLITAQEAQLTQHPSAHDDEINQANAIQKAFFSLMGSISRASLHDIHVTQLDYQNEKLNVICAARSLAALEQWLPDFHDDDVRILSVNNQADMLQVHLVITPTHNARLT